MRYYYYIPYQKRWCSKDVTSLVHTRFKHIVGIPHYRTDIMTYRLMFMVDQNLLTDIIDLHPSDNNPGRIPVVLSIQFDSIRKANKAYKALQESLKYGYEREFINNGALEGL